MKKMSLLWNIFLEQKAVQTKMLPILLRSHRSIFLTTILTYFNHIVWNIVLNTTCNNYAMQHLSIKFILINIFVVFTAASYQLPPTLITSKQNLCRNSNGMTFGYFVYITLMTIWENAYVRKGKVYIMQLWINPVKYENITSIEHYTCQLICINCFVDLIGRWII